MIMPKQIKIHLFLFGLLFSISTSVSAVVIDFDSLEVANSSLNYISSGTYTEDGFTISGDPMYYAGQNHVDHYAGSAGLHLRSSFAQITLNDSVNNAFSIESIGLSVLQNGGVSPDVIFTGTLLDGGTVTQTFSVTEFGFTDFQFDSGFTNLVSLAWNQGSAQNNAHQFDNIVLNAYSVPETTSFLLFALGIAGLLLSRRRR